MTERGAKKKEYLDKYLGAYNKKRANTDILTSKKSNLVQLDPVLIPSSFAVPYRPNQKKKCQKKKCQKKKPITQKDFDCYAKNGLILNKPGYYFLCENINYQPTQIGTSAITITSSKVILDLGRFTLAQGNTVSLTYGIAIARDVRKVKIIGEYGVAEILDFTLAGIRILGRTETITLKRLIVSQSVIRRLTNDQIPESCGDIINLVMTNGIVVGEGNTGYISFKGTDRNNIVKDLVIKNVTSRRAVMGLHIIFTFGCLIEDCLFTENSYYGNLNGYSWPIPSDVPGQVVFPVAANINVRRTRCDRNSGQNADLVNPDNTGIFAFLSGLAFYGTQSCTVEDSSISDNHSDWFHLAVDHDSSLGMTWKNCVTNNNVSDLFVCDGFHMSGSIPWQLGPCLGVDYPFLQNINAVIENCVSTGNRGGFIANGFTFAYVNGASVNNCVSEGQISTGGGIVSGFLCVGDIPGGETRAISFTNCVAQRNGQANEFISAGFYIIQFTQNIIIKDCIINDNAKSTSESSEAFYAGIFINPLPSGPNASSENIVIKDNVINNNGSPIPDNVYGFSGGIVVLQDLPNTSIKKVLIEGNTVTYNNDRGILVFRDPNVSIELSGVVIKKNEVDQSVGNGIEVFGTSNPTLVAANIAYDNGGSNYVGVPLTDIIVATIGTLPDTVGLKNVSITPV